MSIDRDQSVSQSDIPVGGHHATSAHDGSAHTPDGDQSGYAANGADVSDLQAARELQEGQCRPSQQGNDLSLLQGGVVSPDREAVEQLVASLEGDVAGDYAPSWDDIVLAISMLRALAARCEAAEAEKGATCKHAYLERNEEGTGQQCAFCGALKAALVKMAANRCGHCNGADDAQAALDQR